MSHDEDKFVDVPIDFIFEAVDKRINEIISTNDFKSCVDAINNFMVGAQKHEKWTEDVEKLYIDLIAQLTLLAAVQHKTDIKK